jgi:hypothetical protein
MYLSHPVRRMRDDPIAGETATLVVELSEPHRREAVEALVAEHDGSVRGELRFADLAVSVPEPAVASLCDLPGIERIETTDTLSQVPTGVEE